MNAIILGGKSDIAMELAARLHVDGWTVWNWQRGQSLENFPQWSLLICAIGTLKPVGKFFEQDWAAWREGFQSNVLEPLRLVHSLYEKREPDASICFFGGTNPFKANPRYSAYSSAKAALRIAVRDIAAECPHLRVFLLDTGVVPTKIHVEPVGRSSYTTHEQIYTALQRCLKAKITNVSGHFFYVPNIAP